MMICKDMSDVAMNKTEASLALRTSQSGRWAGKAIQGSSQ